MYGKLKDEFIDFLKGTSESDASEDCKSTLKSCEEVENMLSKDVNEFSYSELIYLFEYNNWITYSTASSNKSRIMKYCEWCADGKLSKDAPIVRLKFSDLKGVSSYLTKYCKDLDDLLDCLTDIFSFSDVDELWVDCNKILFALVFAGFTPEETGWIRLADVNRISNSVTVITNSSTFTSDVDPRIVQLMVKVCGENTVGVQCFNTIGRYPLRDDGHVLRSLDMREPNYSKRAAVLARLLTEAKKRMRENEKGKKSPNYSRDITLSTAFKSGMFYRALHSPEGGDPTFFLGKERTVKTAQQAARLSKDFQNWKRVHYKNL